MNILSMLARLEGALGRTGLTKQMVLLPQTCSLIDSSAKEISFVVGYNGSPRSQTALDLTLWIAHQTRLATQKQVTVQVVYVLNLSNECGRLSPDRATFASPRREPSLPMKVGAQSSSYKRSKGTTQTAEITELAMTQSCQVQQFDEADRILWQARNLAEEWRGSLKTHLRFGEVAEELHRVVEAESASILLLGCESADNTIVQQLGSAFPCPVLGIPTALAPCSQEAF